MTQKPQERKLPANTSLILELFDHPSDLPSAIVLIPRGCDAQTVLASAQSGKLSRALPIWHIFRKVQDSSLATLVWLHGEWDESATSLGSHRLTILTRLVKSVPITVPINDTPTSLTISDPACFPLAGIFFPPVFRTKELGIHATLHKITTAAEPTTPPPTDSSIANYAIRWTVRGQARVWFLRCPANLPPAMLRTLLLGGSKILTNWTGIDFEMAGPAIVQGIDPRLRCLEWHYSLTIRQKTIAATILIPDAVCRQLEEYIPSGLPATTPTYNPDFTLIVLLAINRRLLDQGAQSILQDLDASDENALACFIADNTSVFSTRDLKFIVQNYLVPQGNQAILDFFFPRGLFDPTIWARISQVLGENLSQALAALLKKGLDPTQGLTTESARALLRSVTSKRLELGPRGETLIKMVLGMAIDGESRRILDPLIALGIPGQLLARIPAGERMKALANLTDRERSMAFYGQRNDVLVLMEAFSQKGKQREQDDYDLMVKGVERGDIDYASLIQARTEACQFIAEHIITNTMAKALDADWKELRAKLKLESLIFLLESPISCLAENPLRQKLSLGLAPIEIKGIKEKLNAAAKLPGYVAIQPAIIHRELILLLTPDPIENKPESGKKEK